MVTPPQNFPDETENQEKRANPEVSTLPQQQLPPGSLEDLIRLAGPLANTFFEHEERKHQREISFETEVLKQDVGWRKMLLLAGTSLGFVVFVVAGILFYHGRDETALDLIKLVVAVAGALLGGYGIGRTRQRKPESEE